MNRILKKSKHEKWYTFHFKYNFEFENNNFLSRQQ